MINYYLCSKCEHKILERVVLQLKRLHKIATVRRLVALTMLSTLLLSSTAVYADTAEDDGKTSQEVVIETGNTSNDTNSSTNQNDTVSGRDSIDNSNTTTTEYDKEDTNKGDSDSSDLNADSKTQKPADDDKLKKAKEELAKDDDHDDDDDDDVQPCEHQWKTVTEGLGNNEHATYEVCELCGETQNYKTSDCEMVEDSRAIKKTYNGKHLITGKCKICGQSMTEEEDCDFSEWGNPTMISWWSHEHQVERTCSICGVTQYKNVPCNFEKLFFGLERCKDCHSINDQREASVVVENVEYQNADGSSLAPTETVTDQNGYAHKVFDNSVKLVVTVKCQNFNNGKDEQFWKDNMQLTLCVNTPDKDTKQMSLVSGSVTADGTAKFECTVDAPESKSLTIAGVQASYEFKESYGLLGIIGLPKTIKGNGSIELSSIIRNSNPEKHMENAKMVVANEDGSWTQGANANSDWYSKKINGNNDLVVTITAETGKAISNAAVALTATKGSKRTVEQIPYNPSVKETYDSWGNAFKNNVYITYVNTLSYKIDSSDKFEDGVTTYNLTNSNFSDDINVYIDNTAPTATVEYKSAATKMNDKYYNQDVTVEVNAVEEHIDTAKSAIVVSNHKNVDGEGKFAEGSNTTSIVVGEESAHVVSGTIYDLAGNSVEIKDEPEFIVDKTAPVLTIKFDNNEFKHDKYFKADRTATFTLTDVNIDSKEADMSKVTVNAKGGKHTVNQMTGSNGNYTGSIVFDQDGTYSIGNIEFADKAGNKWVASSDMQDDYNKEFVIDKTAPVITVEFDNNSFLNGNYYKDARVATIDFKELNFTSDQVSVKKNSGEELAVPGFSAYTDRDDSHITKITFDKDGKYGFTLSCEDMAGNMSNTYVSDDFVIDMTAPELEITGVTDMSANNGRVVPVIKSKDMNLTDACTEITLTGSNNGTISPSISKTSGTGLFTYEIADIAHEKANDDLYTLNVKLTDLAGNKVEKTYKYSLNRFGSIFVLSDATKAMVDNYYVTSPQDVVITEINVDSLTSKEVSVAHDGNVKNVAEGRGYQVSDLTNNKGWHSISYTVNASNFKKDGMYSVTVFSEDKATNKQSNQSKDAEVKFLMDATAPSVVVSGLEDEGVYEEASHDFSVNAADTMGVEKMSVLLNGDKLGEYSAKELSENGGTVVLTIPSKDDYQKVEIICSDIAGNKVNLAYNNILVSEKAEELLISDNLTPTTGDNDAKAAVGTSVINNISKVIAIAGIIAAIVMIGAVVVITNRKKANN